MNFVWQKVKKKQTRNWIIQLCGFVFACAWQEKKHKQCFWQNLFLDEPDLTIEGLSDIHTKDKFYGVSTEAFSRIIR